MYQQNSIHKIGNPRVEKRYSQMHTYFSTISKMPPLAQVLSLFTCDNEVNQFQRAPIGFALGIMSCVQS